MKMDRLLAIVMLLLNRKRVSAKELAERFEVSLRTIYRDVETINQAGIPVISYAGTAGGYEVTDQYRLERQLLTLEELYSLVIALKGVRSTMDDRHIGGLLDKVGALLAKPDHDRLADAEQRLIIDINPWREGKAEKDTLNRLKDATQSSKLAEFTYTSGNGEQTRRICEPMGVVLKGYVWYLYGYCRIRGDYRIFRLSRLRDLSFPGDIFARRPVSLQHLDLRWGRMSEAFTPVRLVLRFHPRARARVVDYYEPHQIQETEDGYLQVETQQPDEPWLHSQLLSYGTDVNVLEPVKIAILLKEKALEIARQYM
jgi:predicted DNA-binding transcriptional regulator YafY